MVHITLGFLLGLSSLVSTQTGAVVDLGYARYRGLPRPDGIVQWLGMRYAAPPVGPLRFAAPQDPESVDGVQNAFQHGPQCIPTGEYPIPEETSEDCLFVDVQAPTMVSQPLPVFVWIEGGGFSQNSQANYDASGLIQASGMGIVVVTFNYRVGPYGFLSGAEVQRQASVNNGLKDQIHVLKWVQKHIRKFGGDPNHVVLGGVSAGAASITLLLSAYGGRDDGLFHAAAAESQSFAGMQTVDESQFAYNNLVIRTGCASDDNTLACLRRLDVARLQQANINTPLPKAQDPPLYLYGPVVDGLLVPDYTYRLFRRGHFIRVPVIFGDVTDEGTIFVPRNLSSVGEAHTFLQSQFPELQLRHLAHIHRWYYGQGNQTRQFPDAGPYWVPTCHAYGEMRYTCPGIDLSSVYAHAGLPSWNYHYAVRDPRAEAVGNGTSHTVDVNSIWGPSYVTDNGFPPQSYLSFNAPIVPVVQGYWTSFIRTLDPNPHRLRGTPKWKTWGRDEESHRRLFIRTGDTRMETVPPAQRKRCEYLISIGTDLGQ
ncbi:hypothetical protein EYZ11_007464 [Aspergillus tanneri]|uniref:Carboxylic ester hydrolase n=1 Tax=Aspergillus tanneri TaxID=1220188 RepID=A0A4S3JF77_9EURO|nr:uncharacterized protein ATNIH1004_011152 [Aspergillus tanneri]KAA8642211.1 hypothetical protein ATNIH1004_011152 [Aspergillus tanneri]THC93067.1 hypothetical protein EYZ11_007464 [Aspergillus tanneri]